MLIFSRLRTEKAESSIVQS